MESDLEKCFLLLNQTVALAEFLSLDVVLGIKTPSNQRCWSTNCKNFQYELISHELTFQDNDVWLKSGKVTDQKVIEKDMLFDLTADCLTAISAQINPSCASGCSIPEKHSFEDSNFPDVKSDHLGTSIQEVPQQAKNNENEELEIGVNEDDHSIASFEEENPGPCDTENKHRISKDPELAMDSHESSDSKVEIAKCISADDEFSSSSKCESGSKGLPDENEKARTSKKFVENLNANELTKSLLADQCPKCDVEFTSNEQATAHFRQFHFQCVECGRKFSRAKAVTQHITNVHRGLKPYKCYLCERRFGHTGVRFYHMKKVHNQLSPYAKTAHKQSPVSTVTPAQTTLDLQLGEASSDLKEEDATSCNVLCRITLCSKVFMSAEEEVEHYRDVHCKCGLCDLSFRSEANLKEHVKGVHERVCLHPCKVCGVKFRSKSIWSAHMSKNHPKVWRKLPSAVRKRLSCSKCERTFDTEAKRFQHMKFSHSHAQCRICDAVFCSATNLKRHVLNVHDKVKPFECLKCDYRCAQKSNLKIHGLLVHQ